MKIGFRLWMRNVFTESLSMEFKRWKREMNTWFFSKENALSSHTKEWLHSLDTFQVSRVWSILIRNPLPCLTVVCVCVCVCVCWQIGSGKSNCRESRSCNSQPVRPLRSQDGCEVHGCTLRQTLAM